MPTKRAENPSPPGIAQRWPSLLLIKLGRITMHRYTEALAEFNVRPRQVAALIELRDRGSLTQAALCGELHLDPTNVVAVLNELERHGYATRRRDEEDRRRHIVEITSKGRKLLERVTEVMDRVEAEMLDGLSRADRAELEKLLTAMWSSTGAALAAATERELDAA